MSKKSQHIALMEKLLMHLKNAKLEYLKASDHVNCSEEKRFFNQQALIRNRFFQDILRELQALEVTLDDLIISRFNFDQLLVSTIDALKATAVKKCLEADKVLFKLYKEFIDLGEYKNSEFIEHSSIILNAINKNQVLVDSYFFNKQINSDY